MKRRQLLSTVAIGMPFLSGCMGGGEPSDSSTETVDGQDPVSSPTEESNGSYSPAAPFWGLPPSESGDYILKLVDFHEGSGVSYPELAMENLTTQSIGIRNFKVTEEHDEKRIFEETYFEAKETKSIPFDMDIRDANDIRRIQFNVDADDDGFDGEVCYSEENITDVGSSDSADDVNRVSDSEPNSAQSDIRDSDDGNGINAVNDNAPSGDQDDVMRVAMNNADSKNRTGND